MPTGYRALGFPDSKMPGYGRTRGSIGSSLLQINADSTLHLLMLSSCLLRSKFIQPFLFFPCSANTPPENTPASVHYLLRLMFAISASFAVQPGLAIRPSESFEECGNVPSLESTETCGLAFQRHVCDTNAHPAWTLIVSNPCA
jgi:hypothetical protein